MLQAIVLWETGKKNEYSISENPQLNGFVHFKQISKDKPVKVSISLYGLPDGEYGFHVHENSINCIDYENVQDCCNSLGGHFHAGEKWDIDNPYGTKHGNHTGDLCFNIFFEDGECIYNYVDEKISLFPKEKNNIVERSLVIHNSPDDLGIISYEEEEKNINRFITGNAGERIACGRILPFPNNLVKF